MRMTRTVVLALTLVPLAAWPAPAGEAAQARSIIDRAIEAAGGEARLARFKAAEWTARGTGHASAALDFTDRYYVQWPEQFRHESAIRVKGQKFERALVLNGEQGWVRQDGATVAMNDTAVAELRDKVRVLCLAATLLPLKDKAITLKPLDDMKIAGRPAVGVTASFADHSDLHLYFDKDNGLLLKCERTVKDPLLGRVSEETYFDDYHEVDGVQVARKVAVKRDGKPFLDWSVTDFRVRAKLDRGLFGRP